MNTNNRPRQRCQEVWVYCSRTWSILPVDTDLRSVATQVIAFKTSRELKIMFPLKLEITFFLSFIAAVMRTLTDFDEGYCFPGYDAMSFGRWVPTLWWKLVSLSLG